MQALFQNEVKIKHKTILELLFCVNLIANVIDKTSLTIDV